MKHVLSTLHPWAGHVRLSMTGHSAISTRVQQLMRLVTGAPLDTVNGTAGGGGEGGAAPTAAAATAARGSGSASFEQQLLDRVEALERLVAGDTRQAL
jgi:hypothetical protein